MGVEPRDADVAAGTAFLAGREDVAAGRIGVVGLSMGGEEAIGAAASDPRIRAVVAEGVTARSSGDQAWLSDEYGVRGALQERLDWLRTRLTDLLTEAQPPTVLREAVEAAGDVSFLLVTAGRVPDEGHAARHLAAAAPERVEVWTVADASHTGGLGTQPDEWEQRVVTFLDTQLSR